MKWFTVALLLFLSLSGMSQTNLPEYGNITPADFKMTECPFDKEAEAVILFEKAVATHNDDYNLIIVTRVRMKILKAKGIERGTISIPYYSSDDFTSIYDIKGYVQNIDNNKVPYITNLEKSSIFRNKVNENYTELKLVMPEVKVGSIIEYQYETRMKSYAGLREWEFQTDIPTVVSHFDLTILPQLSFAYKINKSAYLPITIKPFEQDGRIIFEMKEIASLRNEPFMDARDDYRQKVIFQIAQYQSNSGVKQKFDNTWEDLGRDLLSDESFGRQIGKNIGGAEDLIKLVKLLPTPYERMNAIYTHIRKNFSWNGFYSKYAETGLRRVWDKKSGDCGEINLLLINLLQEAGLDAIPVLVSERDHGRVNATYPFRDQFNKVAAYVRIGNMSYVLDGTSIETPAYMIPFDLVNTTGFLVERKKPKLIPLEDSLHIQKVFIGVISTLSSNGILKGNAVVNSFDYSRMEPLQYLKNHTIREYAENYLVKSETDMTVDSLVIQNKENDSLPLEQKFDFKVSMPSSGDYYTIDLNLFSGLNKSPFVSDIRFTNINFGTPYTKVLTQLIELPEDLKPEPLPKNINLVMPDNSISVSRITNYDPSTRKITIRIKIQILKPVFSPDEYPSIKEFYKKMVGLLNESVVVKKG